MDPPFPPMSVGHSGSVVPHKRGDCTILIVIPHGVVIHHKITLRHRGCVAWKELCLSSLVNLYHSGLPYFDLFFVINEYTSFIGLIFTLGNAVSKQD
jgi:hypothetical protein